MNEKLKEILSKLTLDGNLRVRLLKIFDKSEPVTSVDLRGFEHGKRLEVKKEDLSTLLHICSQIPNLQQLAIVGSTLDNDDAQEVAKFLSLTTSLNTLYLDGKNISDEGGKHFAPVINTHPNLSTLYIHGKIGDEGTELIAKAILENKNIEKLSLEGPQIGEKGITALSRLLDENRLKQLCITCESLNAQTGEVLAKSVARDNKLQGFSLEVNNIENLDILLDGLKINSFLTDILLFVNNLSEPESKKIEKEILTITQRNKAGQNRLFKENMGDILSYLHQQLNLRTTFFDTWVQNKATQLAQDSSAPPPTVEFGIFHQKPEPFPNEEEQGSSPLEQNRLDLDI